MHVESFNPLSFFIHRGEPWDYMFSVLSGLVEVLNEDIQLAIHHPGDFICASFLGEGAIWTTDVQEIQDDVVVARNSIQDFQIFKW